MNTRLSVGRIGDHVGPSAGVAFAVDTVTIDCLLDADSRESLIGKPIEINHDGGNYGTVINVDSELTDGVLLCDAELTDAAAIEYIAEAKRLGQSLETSPTFACDIYLDDRGRRLQNNRRYYSLSILTQGWAGRGGPDVNVKYNYGMLPMDEILTRLSGLEASMASIEAMLKNATEPEPTEAEQYSAGLEAGKAFAKTEYALSRALAGRKLSLKPSDTLLGMLQLNLPSLGIKAENKPIEYCLGALNAWENASTKTEVTPAPVEQPSGKIRLNLRKGAK